MSVQLLVLVRRGKVTDHHVSDRKQRAPVLLMALASILAGSLFGGVVMAGIWWMLQGLMVP